MTQAEQAYDQFKRQIHPDGTNRTVSLILISEHMEGIRHSWYAEGRKVIQYTFPDDSFLHIRGVGIHHKVETFSNFVN